MRNLPETLANSSLDAAIKIERPVQAKSVRLVTIDDNDYSTLFHSRSPLDAPALAKLLEALAKGHPRAIVVDIDTSDVSFRDMPTPQIPIVWNASGQEFADGKFAVYAPLGGRPMPPHSVAALAVAPQDDRGIVRGYQHTYLLESGGTVDSPGYAAARMDLGHSPEEHSSRGGETHYLDFRYRFAPVKAQDLLADAESEAWDKMALFAGQVVVVGGTYRAGRDQYATPKGLMNGCEIVAQSAAAEIDGTFISSANRWTTGLLMVLGGLITMAVYHWLKFRMAFLVSLGMVPTLSIASNFILFHRFAAWGAMVPLVIAVIVA
jgi:CHASE2 domain-containing sensor protein